jgi:hypothetical protein
MTIMEILNMIKGGTSPELIAKRVVEARFGATPMGANLISMINNRQYGEIEKVARNMTAARGGDFDKEFNDFRRNAGL